MSMKKSSFVWDYFVKEGTKSARCIVDQCGKVLAAGSGASNLSKHLRIFHAVVDKDGNEAGSSESTAQDVSVDKPTSSKRQRTINDCFKFTSFEETIARLVAQDGLTFKQITESTYIRQALARDFPSKTIPKNQSGMAEIVEKFYKDSKQQTIEKLGKLKQQGLRFSATLDEWTSLKNTRYININIHYSISINKTAYINLGMVEIVGSCPADKMLELVSCLVYFTLDFDNFVCCSLLLSLQSLDWILPKIS